MSLRPELEPYCEAIAEMIGPEVAHRFAGAAIAPGSEADADLMAAMALEQTMLDRLPPEPLTLSSVELALGAAVVLLRPHEAFAHPLLADWTCESFAEGLAMAIQAGRLMTSLAAGAPVYDAFSVSHGAGGAVFAQAHLSFNTPQGWATAQYRYGNYAAQPFARTTAITGSTVFLIGSRVRERADMIAAADDATAAAELPSALGLETLH